MCVRKKEDLFYYYEYDIVFLGYIIHLSFRQEHRAFRMYTNEPIQHINDFGFWRIANRRW